jgi:type IV pilus assembly protein PilO
MTRLSKQSIVSVLIGVIVFGALWFSLGSRREQLDELKNSHQKLALEVEKGHNLKSSYEKLKNDVGEQEVRIAELVDLFALEKERSRVTYMIQKLATSAGLGQLQDQKNTDRPVKNEYYSEYPSVFKYQGGFHEFGHFLSFTSGYEKIINISDIVMTRNANNKNTNSASIEFRLSVYVYDPSADKPASKPISTAKTAKNGDRP